MLLFPCTFLCSQPAVVMIPRFVAHIHVEGGNGRSIVRMKFGLRDTIAIRCWDECTAIRRSTRSVARKEHPVRLTNEWAHAILLSTRATWGWRSEGIPSRRLVRSGGGNEQWFARNWNADGEGSDTMRIKAVASLELLLLQFPEFSSHFHCMHDRTTFCRTR